MAVNDQTKQDTAAAKAKQNGGDGGTSASTMDQREAAAGLNLAGNDTMSGRQGGISIPTMDQRESAAGLTGTSAGREDSFYNYQSRQANPWQSVDSEAFAPMSPTEFKDDSNIAQTGFISGQYEDNQDFGPGGSFAITINGTTTTDENGNTVQTSPFTIDCNAGTGTYPANGTGTTPHVVNFPSPTGISATPSSSGVTSWRVYAKVGATITSNGIDVNANGTIQIVEVADATDLVGSNTKYKATSSTTYDFYFLIGSVDAKRQSLGGKYNVKVTQIQNGNYSYGNVESTTATAGGATVSTKDGLRKFTICINGEPFTADIDVSNIVKVT